MSLEDLVNHAVDKKNFQTIQNYISFCRKYFDNFFYRDIWNLLSSQGQSLEEVEIEESENKESE